jgi:ribosome-binding protein aMBF1 (putative translation factor)
MTQKRVHRFTNPSKVTATEAAEARRLRALVKQDKNEIVTERGRFLAGNRARVAADKGRATLGHIIRAAREAHGLTQPELAARVRVALAYLSYLEQDQREPSLSVASRIARELTIPLDELASKLMQ